MTLIILSTIAFLIINQAIFGLIVLDVKKRLDKLEGKK